jgi:hypothetical protein
MNMVVSEFVDGALWVGSADDGHGAIVIESRR